MSRSRRIAAPATLRGSASGGGKKQWQVVGGKPCGSPRRRPWRRCCSPKRAVALRRAAASPAGAGRAPAAKSAATTRSASRRAPRAAAEATVRSVPRWATPAARSPPATRRAVVPAAGGRVEAEAPVEAAGAARLPPPSTVSRILPRRAAPWARTAARRSVAPATRAAWTASTAAARGEAAVAGAAPPRSAAGDSTSATAPATRRAPPARSRVARRPSAFATRLAASDWTGATSRSLRQWGGARPVRRNTEAGCGVPVP